MNPDPYRYFRVEAVELTEQLGQGVLDLERSPPDRDSIARLLRLSHTLKGAARVVQQLDIANRAHTIEERLVEWGESEHALSPERAGVLLALLDAVNDGIAALGGGTPAVEPVAAPASVGAGPGPPEATPPTAEPPPVEATPAWRTDTVDVDGLFDAIGEAQEQFTPVWRAIATLDEVRRSLQHRAMPAREAVGGGHGRTTTRELAAIGQRLVQSLESTERALKDVRSSAERLRLVPASAIFSTLRRAVRDVATLQGKQVDLGFSGGEIRMDPHVLSTVHSALLHAVRNAVAHGIETEARRRATGKPATGRVSLTVSRRGTRVAFTCCDDGEGFDLEAVRRAAQRAGLSAADTATLASEQLVTLALAGGITTSNTVTEVAGRGIGLDVVRDVAEQLGGEVTVHTEAGLGATIELEVPLSRVSVTGLLADVAGATVTIPLDSVRHAMRLRPADVAWSSSGGTVSYEGGAIPFLPLTQILASAGRAADEERSLVAVVVVSDRGAAAVGVDRILGTAPVVVRPLPDLAFGDMDTVGGLSIDIDGNPRLVLDPQGLIGHAHRMVEVGPPDMPDPERPPPTILVVDDSLTTRMLERNILEVAGYDVEVASSGEEALEKARKQRFALFLVDIEMPGMDGFTFIEHTQADPDLRDIPSILVSSRSSEEDRQRGVRAGARTHVAKGEFDQNHLLRSIEALVS